MKHFLMVASISAVLLSVNLASATVPGGGDITLDPQQVAVAVDAANGRVLVYGKMSKMMGNQPLLNIPYVKGTPLQNLMGNPCEGNAAQYVNLRASYNVTTAHSEGENAWTSSERKEVSVPGFCEDIGYCSFRCMILQKDLDKLAEDLKGQYYSYLLANRSKDPVEYSQAIAKDHLAQADADADQDLVPDLFDNCDQKNLDQLDRDHNYKGDACEDPDKDGVPNQVDLCPTMYNPGQEDVNKDGMGDACPIGAWPSTPVNKDSDGDGITDLKDNCPFQKNPNQGADDCKAVLGEPLLSPGADTGGTESETGGTEAEVPSGTEVNVDAAGGGAAGDTAAGEQGDVPATLRFADDGAFCALTPGNTAVHYGWPLMLTGLIALMLCLRPRQRAVKSIPRTAARRSRGR